MNATSECSLQKFFLARLQFMVRRHQQEADRLTGDFAGRDDTDLGEDEPQWHRQLLDRGIYSAYLDCLESGVGDEARTLLSELRQVPA